MGGDVCDCVCLPITCPGANEIVNSDCICVCNLETQCENLNEILNPSTCECETAASRCRGFQTYDLSTDACLCNADDNVCLEFIDLPFLDRELCECTCDKKSDLDCTDPALPNFDSATCSCVCDKLEDANGDLSAAS